MAGKTDSVWAIDIGSNSIKAMRLTAAGNSVEVIGFDDIQHSKILSGGNVKPAERDELIAISLRQFVNQNNLGKDDVIISVPGQNSFARFVNLPPVEQKRIPEIVKFEAVQQIPFDINDVQWDWQMVSETGSPEAKVGIFAVKSDVVNAAMEHFSRENLRVSTVQITPMALYNYLVYDRPELFKSDNQAIVIVNMGAENTDLVVCTRSAVWQRCVTMGGNAFTKAIAETFKLNFEKAEKLKRTAPMSKYARQILQAMKPVFTDLASEMQRSIGFYTNSNPSTKIVKIIALGGGTKMRGLVNYLQQTIQVPIERPDAFKKLVISADVSAAKFHESVCDFGIVYGLALQGLGLGRIESNLLPRSVARSMVWASKARHFAAAALVLLGVSLMCLGRTLYDKVSYSSKANLRQKVTAVVKSAEQVGSRLNTEKSKGTGSEATIQKEFKIFEYRNVIPQLYQTISSALPNEKNTPEQTELYKAFASNDVAAVSKIPRKERKQIFITSAAVYFASDIENAKFGTAEMGIERGIGKKTEEEGGGEEETGIPEGLTGTIRAVQPGAAKAEQQAGFIVTIAGYSPYRNTGELIDPSGTKNDRSKWGFVTRLLHLNDPNVPKDANSPFELYKKAELKHFKLEIGEVGIGIQMPLGIGVQSVRVQKQKKDKMMHLSMAPEEEAVLIDPMTKEIISRVAALDKDGKNKVDRTGGTIYEANDHWFVLSMKFVWKNASKETAATGS
jgi:type IV pilus assembly protein PilM